LLGKQDFCFIIFLNQNFWAHFLHLACQGGGAHPCPPSVTPLPTLRERLGNIHLLSVERVLAEKLELEYFVDEFDSRRDSRRIKSHCVDVDMKYWRRLCRDLCENHTDHCLFVWIFFWFIWGSACLFV